MSGRDDEARLTEAVLGLEQAVSGIAAVLDQHGAMLQRLLEVSTAAPAEETRLHELVLALIARLDAQAGVLERLEAGFGQIGAAVDRSLAAAAPGLPGRKGQG